MVVTMYSNSLVVSIHIIFIQNGKPYKCTVYYSLVSTVMKPFVYILHRQGKKCFQCFSSKALKR